MKKPFILLFIITCSTIVQAQKLRKFGAITKDEIAMTQYDKDPDAKAVVLYELGKSDVTYNANTGLNILYKVHRVIKIFEDDVFHRGDITIRYPDNSAVSGLKAVTYNVKNGKLEKSPLNKADIFNTKLANGIHEKKFAMPDLAPGCIIEYTYTIKTGNFFSLNNWYFQSTIPTIWSEYRISYPEWFKYTTLSQGYLSFYISTKNEANFNIGGQSVMGWAHRYVIKDAPAFKTEKYTSNYKNFLAKIDFELAAIQIYPSPGNAGYFQQFFSDFEAIRTTLLDDLNFGKRLKSAGFMKEEIAQVKANSKSEEEAMAALYKKVRDHANWNNRYSMYADISAHGVYNGKEAASADINLFLTAVMREAGFDASPVILSTRDHGFVHPVYPLIQKYNHVICQIKHGEKTYLLDAIDKKIPFNMLPENDLNDRGRLISEKGSKWVKLKPTQPYGTFIKTNMTITDEGTLEGEMDVQYSGYAAVSVRKEIDTEGLDHHKNSLASSSEGWDIREHTVKGLEEDNKPVEEHLEVSQEGSVENLGDIIYLNPIIAAADKENPFKMKERLYPVDYAYPYITDLTFTYKIPEGFKLDDKPADASFALPNKWGTYDYTSTFEGNTLVVKSVFRINRPVFEAKYYQKLKDFYDQVVAKQAEQFVFKSAGE